MTKVNNNSKFQDLFLNYLMELLKHLLTSKQKRSPKKLKKGQINFTNRSILKITFLQMVFTRLSTHTPAYPRACTLPGEHKRSTEQGRRVPEPQPPGRGLAGRWPVFPRTDEQSPRAFPWISYFNRRLVGEHGKFPRLHLCPLDIL